MCAPSPISSSALSSERGFGFVAGGYLINRAIPPGCVIRGSKKSSGNARERAKSRKRCLESWSTCFNVSLLQTSWGDRLTSP